MEEPVAQEWQVVCRIADTSTFMCTLDTTSFYLGNITSLKSGKTIRSGYGISLENGRVYIGNWKRDLKHGKGIMQKEDGSFICAEWKWDKLQKDKARPATDEEIVAFKEEIERLHSLVRMCKR